METLKIDSLKPYKNNPRKHSDKQIAQIVRSIKTFGFTIPILVDEKNQILAGHGRWLAAIKAGIKEVPVVQAENLTEAQKKAYIIADNKLAENSVWDTDLLSVELKGIALIDDNFDLSITGFDAPEVDLLFFEESDKKHPEKEEIPINIPPKVKTGEIWALGLHRLYCGDSLQKESYSRLLGQEKADIVIADSPYNVKIDGHARSKGGYKEFAMASGEMSEAEFIFFLKKAFANMSEYSKDGSLHYAFIDWRHMSEILSAGKIYSELKNLCIWNKLSGGMGSLYRSQHELVFVFKKGTAPHTNNIELGKHGRYRTNVWNYPGIFINNKVNKENIKLHPTVKPVGLLADILLDASKRGDIVLDPFGGSGSTLLAAERTGRKARIIEIDPHYCDVTIYRWEKMTGAKASLVEENIEEL